LLEHRASQRLETIVSETDATVIDVPPWVNSSLPESITPQKRQVKEQNRKPLEEKYKLANN